MFVHGAEHAVRMRLGLVSLAVALASCSLDGRVPDISDPTGVGGEAGLGSGLGGAGGSDAVPNGAAGGSAAESLGGATSAQSLDAGGTTSTAGTRGAAGTQAGLGGAPVAGAGGQEPGTDEGPDAGSLPEGEPEPAELLTGSLASNFARARVFSEQGKSYIVQNNNFANPGVQRVFYEGPSFTVIDQTGTSASGNPVSFPSIYIGRNGDQSNGTVTSADDNLPIQVSQLTSIATTFTHNATSGHDADAVFELWFVNQPPTGQYDVVDAYVVVILHLPAGRAPIGNSTGLLRSIEGRTWRVWRGERAGGAPVTSYQLEIQSITQGPLNLEPFVRDAVLLQPSVTNAMYLTDVFAGFEIWSGSVGLSLTNLSIDVQ